MRPPRDRDAGSSGKVVVLLYRNGKVELALETWSKWRPEIVHERDGRDLAIVVPDDASAPRRGEPGGPPLTAEALHP